jgi:hypothetical protein
MLCMILEVESHPIFHFGAGGGDVQSKFSHESTFNEEHGGGKRRIHLAMRKKIQIP